MNKSNKIPMVQDILFVCDRKACGDNCIPECRHTINPSHAVNFTLFADGSVGDTETCQFSSRTMTKHVGAGKMDISKG